MVIKLFFVFILICFEGFLSKTNNLHAIECVEPNYDNELILELYLKNYRLTDSFIAYTNKNNELLIPVVDLFELLDLKFDDSDEQFNSKVFAKNTMLKIDFSDNLLEINSTKYPKDQFIQYINQEKIACYDDIYYIEDSILKKLLQSKIKYSKASQRLNITSKRLFPIDIKRIKYQLKNSKTKPTSDDYISWFEKLKKRYNSYDNDIETIQNNELLSMYLLSLSLDVNSKRDYKFGINTNLRLFDHEIKYTASKNKNSSFEYSYKVKKIIMDEDIQPYVAKYEFGDSGLSTENGIVKSYSGKGIKLSNRTQNRSISNYIDLMGILPEDWFVELYVNDRLVSYAQTNKYNKYKFNNIRLISGKNKISYIFYGPLGEIEEKEENYYISSAYRDKNKFWYNLEYIHDDVNQEFDALHLSATYGLTSYITSSIKSWQVSTYKNNIMKKFTLISPGFNFKPTDWFGIHLSYPYYPKNKKMNAQFYDMYIKPFDNFSSFNIKYNKYSKDYKPIGIKTFNKTYDGIFSTSINIPFINKDLDFDRKFIKKNNKLYFEDKYSISAKITKNINAKLKIKHLISSKIKNYDAIFTQRNGKNSNAITFKINDDANARNQLRNIMYNGTFVLNKKIKSTSRINYYKYNGNYSIGTTLSYGNNAFTSAINFRTNNERNHFVGLSFKTKILNYNHSIYDMKMIRNANINRGIALIDVFLVDDENNILERIDNTMIKIDGRNYKLDDELYFKTENNSTIIPNIKTYSRISINVDENSLPDISWKLVSKPKEIIFYPGKVERLTFYVKPTGELDGIISYKNKKDKIVPFKNKTIYLKNLLYKTIDSTESEEDGYYIFQQIPIGEYFIDISKKDKKKLKLESKEPDFFSIKKDKLFYFDHDVIYK